MLPVNLMTKHSLLLFIFFVFQKPTYSAKIEDRYYKEVHIALSPRIYRADIDLHRIGENLEYIFTEASEFLCQATDGLAGFETVRVLVPSGWTLKDFNFKINRPYKETYQDADFQLVSSGSVRVNRRSDRCGQPGQNVVVPIEFVEKLPKKAELHLINLWSQLRYGVYPETAPGFYHDPVRNRTQPNSCTNKAVDWTATDPTNQTDCSLKGATAVSDGCIVTIANNDTEVKSSILYDVEFPNMKFFCNSNTHNIFAQTPHNTFCGGLSVSEVIEKSPDFADKGKPLLDCYNLSPVAIEFVQYNCRRIFIGVAFKDVKDVTKALDSLAASLSLMLSTTATLTIVVENNKAKNLTMTDMYNVTQQILKNIESDQTQPCAFCVLKTVVEEIQKTQLNWHCDCSFMLISDVNEIENPEQSGDGENPEQSGDGENPEQSGDGENPEQSGDGENPEQSGDGENPEQSGDGEIPEQSGDGKNPEQSGDGENPESGNGAEPEKHIPENGVTENSEAAGNVVGSSDESVRRKRETEVLKAATNITDETNELIKSLQKNSVNFYGISVGDKDVVNSFVDALVSQTNGKAVHLDSLDNPSTVGHLLESLLAISENDQETIVTLVDLILPMGPQRQEISFILNKSKLKGDPRDLLLLIQHQLASSIDNVVLTDFANVIPNCTTFTYLNVTSCKVNIEKPGLIRLSIALSEASPISIRVMGKVDSSVDVINVDTWVEPKSSVSFADDDVLSLTAYLKLGDTPILNAMVTASLENDEGEKTVLTLKDDGQGGDKFANDGLYTCNFNTCTKKGHHNIKYSVMGTNHSCALRNKTGVCEVIGDFVRTMRHEGSILISDCGSPNKLTGSPVKDLRLKDFNTDSLEMTFEWTESWDDEKIINYTIRLFRGQAKPDTKWNETEILGNIKPETKTTPRSMRVQIPVGNNAGDQLTTVATIAIVAMDGNNKLHRSLNQVFVILPPLVESTKAEATVSEELKTLETVTLKSNIDRGLLGGYSGIFFSLLISTIVIACLLTYMWIINQRQRIMCRPVDQRMGSL